MSGTTPPHSWLAIPPSPQSNCSNTWEDGCRLMTAMPWPSPRTFSKHAFNGGSSVGYSLNRGHQEGSWDGFTKQPSRLSCYMGQKPGHLPSPYNASLTASITDAHDTSLRWSICNNWMALGASCPWSQPWQMRGSIPFRPMSKDAWTLFSHLYRLGLFCKNVEPPEQHKQPPTTPFGGHACQRSATQCSQWMSMTQTNHTKPTPRFMRPRPW